MGGKWPAEPLVPASPNLVSLPSCPWGASVLSFSRLFPLPFVLFLSALSLSFCPFPSPEIFLLLSLSSLQPCSSEGAWTSGSYSITPLSLRGRVSSSWQWLTLMGDEPRWERLTPLYTDIGTADSPWPEIYERDRGSNLISCSGWESNCPSILPFISCHPEKFHWKWAKMTDFYILVYAQVSVHLWVSFPKTMYSCLVSGLDHLGG